tara:strand:+ start:446 stop:709 length:264 start_codon:yes stop_codon:yes gene_type:complete
MQTTIKIKDDKILSRAVSFSDQAANCFLKENIKITYLTYKYNLTTKINFLEISLFPQQIVLTWLSSSILWKKCDFFRLSLGKNLKNF